LLPGTHHLDPPDGVGYRRWRISWNEMADPGHHDQLGMPDGRCQAGCDGWPDDDVPRPGDHGRGCADAGQGGLDVVDLTYQGALFSQEGPPDMPAAQSAVRKALVGQTHGDRAQHLAWDALDHGANRGEDVARGEQTDARQGRAHYPHPE
jgi:hypothetical protein